jgi:hypothetical protein
MTDSIQELRDQRLKITTEISKKMEESRTAPPASLGKLALEIAQLQAQEKLIAANLDVLGLIERQREQAEKDQLRKASEDKVRKTRDERIEWLKANPDKVLCPQCGFPGKLKEGVKQPQIIGGGLGDPRAHIWMRYVCTNDSVTKGHHVFFVDVDEDLEVKKKQPRNKKFTTPGHLLNATNSESTTK